MTTQIAKRRKTGDLIQPEQRPAGPQAVFDLVIAAARAQPVQSTDEYGECRYRGEDDTRCFVGHLIPDKDYDEKMEGRPAFAVLTPLGFDAEEIGLLDALQQIHDSQEPHEWESYFAETAEDHQLVYAAPKEVP